MTLTCYSRGSDSEWNTMRQKGWNLSGLVSLFSVKNVLQKQNAALN